MNSLRKPLAITATVIFAAAALQLRPSPAAAQTAIPSRLAVINLAHVFSAITEHTDAAKDLTDIRKKLMDDVNKAQDDATKLQDQLPQFKPDSDEYKSIQEQLVQAAIKADSLARYSQQKLLLEQRLRMALIYRHVNAAVAQYAKANGIAIVFVTDDVDPPDPRSTEDVVTYISTRKILYADPNYDITKDIIEKMNTDYRLGKK